MGIEIFDNNGHIVLLSNPENQIWACPADINILPEYDNDPRTVDNLVDGVNHTSDDLHAWLTPFTMGQDHLVTIDFDEETTISMIRIWYEPQPTLSLNLSCNLQTINLASLFCYCCFH
jgi:hypothetical protein